MQLKGSRGVRIMTVAALTVATALGGSTTGASAAGVAAPAGVLAPRAMPSAGSASPGAGPTAPASQPGPVPDPSGEITAWRTATSRTYINTSGAGYRTVSSPQAAAPVTTAKAGSTAKPNTSTASTGSYLNTLDGKLPTTPASTLTVGSTSAHTDRALISIPVSGIPADAVITDARLFVNSSTGTQTPTDLYGVTTSGAFTTASGVATWNTYDGTHPWTTAGGDKDATASASITPTSTTWSYPITPLATAWLTNARPNNGVLIVAHTENGTGSLNTLTGPSVITFWQPRTGSQPGSSYYTKKLDDRQTISVNKANGNLQISATDEFARSYDSMNAGTDSALGQGWAAPLGITAVNSVSGTGGGTATVTVANNGADAIVDADDGALSLYVKSGSTWVAPPGADADLTAAGSGSTATFTLTSHASAAARTYLNTSGLNGAGAIYQLTGTTDRNGNKTTIHYTNYKVDTVTDPAGRVTTATRTSDGLSLTKITDFAGRQTAYNVATNGNSGSAGRTLTSVTDPNGGVTAYGYDSSTRLASILTPAGRLTRFTYTGTNQVSSIQQVTNVSSCQATPSTCTGPTTAFTYPVAPYNAATLGKTVITDPTGHTTTYTYNNLDQVLTATDALGRMRAGTYGPDANVTTAVDAMGTGGGTANTTTSSYDGLYRPISQQQPLGATDSLTYTAGSFGTGGASTCTAQSGSTTQTYQPMCSSDAQGDVTANTYDTVGNLKAAKDTTPSGTGVSTSATYNPPAPAAPTCGGLPGQVCTTTNGLGGVTTNTYNTLGQLTKTVPPAPLGQTTATYDTAGRVATSTDGKGQVTTTSYDSDDRVTQVLTAGATTCSYAAGTCVVNTYDADGNLLTTTDSTGTTVYTYDALGRQLTKSLPLSGYAIGAGQTTTQGNYTPDSGYSAGTASAGTTNYVDTTGVDNPAPEAVYKAERYGTTFTYTLPNLTAGASYLVRMHFSELSHGGPGQRVFSVAVNGTIVLSNFDIYAAAGGANKAIVRGTTANANANGQIVLSFTTSADAAEIAGVEVSPATATATPALSLAYDAAGNVVTYADAGGTVTYTYDAANELIDLAEPGGTCVQSTGPTVYYDTTPGHQAPASALCTAFAYNANGARTTTEYPGATYQNVAYDNNGRVLSITGTKGSPTGAYLTYNTYTYCTGSTTCPTTVQSPNVDTEYTRTRTDITGTVTTYTDDSLGRLTNASQTNATWAYTYDADGNRLSEAGPTTGSYTFGYNTADQLISRNGSTTGWAYDANGNELSGLAVGTNTRTNETYSPTDQLISLTSNNGGTVSPSAYTYPGLGNTGRISNTGGSTATNYQNGPEGLANQTTSGTTTSWTRDPGGTLISMRTGTTHYYYLFDAEGSVIGLVDNTGTLQATYGYDPYGITSSNNTTLANSNPWRYTSGYQDSTGMYHLGARYYDPSLGRFTQVDPTHQDDLSYGYADDGPTDGSDPTGTFCILGHNPDGSCRGHKYAGYVGAVIGGAIGAAGGCAVGFVLAGGPPGCVAIGGLVAACTSGLGQGALGTNGSAGERAKAAVTDCLENEGVALVVAGVIARVLAALDA